MTGARREVGGETIIDVSGVWKGYHAWAREGRSPREMLRRRLPALIRGGELRWALADVSVGVQAGECVGVIGDNGAGKSTLLRIGAGLSRATRGQVRAPASVGSVLALGEAFDLSLTGSLAGMIQWNLPDRRPLRLVVRPAFTGFYLLVNAAGFLLDRAERRYVRGSATLPMNLLLTARRPLRDLPA